MKKNNIQGVTGLLILMAVIGSISINSAAEHIIESREVCDSISMETYYISCSDIVHKDSTITLDSQRKYFLEECRTQAKQIHCQMKDHVLIRGKWTICDSLPKNKRNRICR